MKKFCVVEGNNSALIRKALLERGVWQEVGYYYIGDSVREYPNHR